MGHGTLCVRVDMGGDGSAINWLHLLCQGGVTAIVVLIGYWIVKLIQALWDL